MKNAKTALLSFIILLLSFQGYCAGSDYSDLTEVLKTFQDSRLTRDLKNSADKNAQRTFTKTLENNVYKPADAETVKYISDLPEYEGKRIITHDFRTPGADGSSVNTDRDVRILAEVEPGRWAEVPADKWKDVYYKEFAKRTGYSSDDRQKIQEHAEKFRQLATDSFHMEASHDYSDQNLKNSADRIKVTQKADGRISVESVPNIVKVKSGQGTLADAESMSMMYFHKSWEQLSRVDSAENISQKNMHTAEGLAQMKKGMETLESVRASYEKQGYDVGRLPENFARAAEIIMSVDGSSSTDVEAVARNLQEYGFKNPADLAEYMRGQTESLKLAQKKIPSSPKISLETAGNIAGFAGNLMSINQRLKEAEQGNHLFWNFDKTDSNTEKIMKAAAVAAVELMPIPLIDALERGWDVGERADKYMEYFRKELERGETDWQVHPAFVMFAMTSTVTAETVASMTVEPLVSGAQAVSEGVKTVRDVSNNFLGDFEREKSMELQREKMTDARDRIRTIDMGEIRGFRGGLNGRSLYDEADYGETLAFQIDRNSKWESGYFTIWELKLPDGRSITMKDRTSASMPDSASVIFAMPDGMPSGQYSAVVRVFETDSLLQADWREKKFRLTDSAGIGSIASFTGHFPESGGKILSGTAKPGDVLAFRAAKNGDWDKYEVQWLVNGELYKKTNGKDPKANVLRFGTDGMSNGEYEVTLRLIDVSGTVRRIAAFSRTKFEIDDKKPPKTETAKQAEQPKPVIEPKTITQAPIPAPAPVQTPAQVQSVPAQTAQSDYASQGRARWSAMAENILNNTIDPCYRQNAPQAYDKIRKLLLNSDMDYDSIGRKTRPELDAFEKEQEKGVAQVIYKTIKGGGFNMECADKTLKKLADRGHISASELRQAQPKAQAQTIYWVVLEQSGSVSSGSFKSAYSAGIVTGKTPPKTGFFNRSSASPSHYNRSVKAYGTLSRQEAEKIAGDINSGRGSAVFARTSSDHIGIKWSGDPNTPLVTYGRGVMGAMK
ncbi:MAG: hypothetical protein AB7E96_02515 [Deferribacterales bacterium]